MRNRLALAILTAAAVGVAAPAFAEEVGVGVGPVGVTVGHPDHDRYYGDYHRDRGDTVIIKKHRDYDFDRPHRRVYIDRD
jgi:hypothetical protein